MQTKQNCCFTEVIDLSDEQGVVKNLRQNLDEYGYEYLKERETVILLRVDCKWYMYFGDKFTIPDANI